MGIRTIVAGLLLLAVTGEACADQICRSRSGVLRMRPTCKKHETALPISIEDGGATVRVTGANLQVVSGSGATDGAENGRGNVVIGYDAATQGQTHTGSHNLVIGDEHEYTSHGGIVAGINNTISAPAASVLGGRASVASGETATVVGGFTN